jgi:AraC-like DNA-binding protein
MTMMTQPRIRDMRYGPSEQPQHAHEEMQISIVLRGTIRETVGAVARCGRAGDVIVKPAGLMHADDFDATRILCIDGPPDAFPTLPREYHWYRFDAVTAAAIRVAQRHFAGCDVSEDLADLLAALPPRTVVDRRLANQAAEALEAGQTNIAALAHNLGVHQVYLARIFRERWNCSPREYAQRMRVREAAHRLASTRQPLAEIALDAGFADQAHLTRIFGRVVGVTPGAFRRLTG